MVTLGCLPQVSTVSQSQALLNSILREIGITSRSIRKALCGLQPGPDVKKAGARARLTIGPHVTSSCSVNPGWSCHEKISALFVKNSHLWMTQQVNSPSYTDVKWFCYTELSALALRSFLVKFKSWNVSTTWHYELR